MSMYLIHALTIIPPPSFLDTCSCPFLYNTADSDSSENFLMWYIDPDYYLFHGCQCSPGFNLVNLSTQTSVEFNCVAPEPPPSPW